ncbi:hypothetical protein ACJIZ3_020368 [Penstemon smallii]|uniref:Btz domain-containing protein n=1 Tax=Penstemon smallii TaxID=265156 RepID=A0ABD3SII6_9LAMI
MAEEETEYESDPEEAKLSLKMRRREASDEEEEEDNRKEKPLPTRRMDDSDEESEGAVAEYEEDELEEDYDLEEYVEDEVEYEEIGAGRSEDIAVEEVVLEKDDGVDLGELMEEKKGVNNDNMNNDATQIDDENSNVVDGQHEEEKKDIEPYAVPTVGAFYMHDDRFRDSAGGGRNRRMVGGRKLWESKDDRKWGHDKFEELTLQERHHEEHRRGSKGHHRGRGGNRGSDRGFARVNRSREYTNNRTQNNNNQNNAPKGVRGRGPRRYQPSFKNENEVHLTQNKQSGKSVEKPSYVVSSARTIEPASNAENDVVLPRKQTSASNLSIASPPFYPSGSSAKDNTFPNKRDVQTGATNRNGQPSVVDKTVTVPQSTAMMRGKNIVDSIGVDKLYIDDSLSGMAGKPSNSLRMPLSGSSSINSTQAHLRGQGRGITSSRQMAYQPAVSNNQLNRVPPSSQLQDFQRNPGQSRVQSSVQVSGQQFTRLPSGTQASTPPKDDGAENAFESGELESASESSKSKTALVTKGNGMQRSGKGSFLYGGSQVMGNSGNIGSGHGDQNFPAFLPVMQFGGQHPGGIGVPAVGMAFPGYVGQPQLGGLGNSEMTWLPVLAGAAGALGPNFCPPYINVDGSYHARPSGQPSSILSASSKENNASRVANDKRPEIANEDFVQRQKNPRRYTEMKFDQ